MIAVRKFVATFGPAPRSDFNCTGLMAYELE